MQAILSTGLREHDHSGPFQPSQAICRGPSPLWQQLFLPFGNIHVSAQTSAGGAWSNYLDGGFRAAGRVHGATANAFLRAFPLHQPPPARLEGLPSPTSVVRNFEVWGTPAPRSCIYLQQIVLVPISASPEGGGEKIHPPRRPCRIACHEAIIKSWP